MKLLLNDTFDVLLQKVTLPADPAPAKLELLSTFCQASVPAPLSTYIAQSPTSQSVIPDRFVEPATLTIQNFPLSCVVPARVGVSVDAFQFPSKANPEGMFPISVST